MLANAKWMNKKYPIGASLDIRFTSERLTQPLRGAQDETREHRSRKIRITIMHDSSSETLACQPNKRQPC